MTRLLCAGCSGELRARPDTDGHGRQVDRVEPCGRCVRRVRVVTGQPSQMSEIELIAAFGDQVRTRRQRREWTQLQLARAAAIGGAMEVSRLERGVRGAPTFRTLVRIAAAFEVAPFELLLFAEASRS